MNKKFIIVLMVLIGVVNANVLCQKLPNLIPYRMGKLWGYCDSNKKIIIKPKYDLSKSEYEGFVILPYFGDDTQKGTINLGHKEIIINRKGKEFERPKPVFVNGAIAIPEGYHPTPAVQTDPRAFDFFSPYVLKNSADFGICKYNVTVSCQMDGYKTYTSYRCFLSTDSSKILVDEHDRVIYKGYKFIWILDTFFLLVDKKGKWSIGNRFGKIITKNLYDEIITGTTVEAGVKNNMKMDDDKRVYSASWGKYLVVRKGIYYGVITLDCKEIIPPVKYKFIKPTVNMMYGIFYAYYNKYDGYIDFKGTEYWKGQNAGKPTPNAITFEYLPVENFK